jgi:pSer/pThr/pTyr-binding forkhead associated (FHA) protein
VFPDKERIYAGRVAGNEIQLKSGTISKRQFMLVFSPRGVVLVDTKSTCGTYVNGRTATAPTEVPEGATIYAGDFQVRIVPR